MYMYNDMSVFISKNVSSHGTSKGSRPISLATIAKEAIGSLIGTSCLFFGLGFRRGFYKIKNICIKVDVICKYKLIQYNKIITRGFGIIRMRCLSQAMNLWNASATVITSSKGSGTQALANGRDPSHTQPHNKEDEDLEVIYWFNWKYGYNWAFVYFCRPNQKEISRVKE